MDAKRKLPSKERFRPEVPLKFTLIGVPAWECQGVGDFLEPIDAAWVAYLALADSKSQTALSGLLWPHKDAKYAIGSLKQRFSALRNTIRHPVCSGGEPARLLSSAHVDVDDRLEDLPVDALLVRGELLAGLSFAARDFQRWLDGQRLKWRCRLISALDRHAKHLEQVGSYAEAQPPVERILTLDSELEPIWLRLMRLQYLQGNRNAAINTYERLERKMAERNLQVHPDVLKLLQHVQRSFVPVLLPGYLPSTLERPPKLIGRERQWLAMERAWNQSVSFLLRGEAGIGKTRLLEDFAQVRPGTLIVKALPGDAQSAYSLLTRVLRSTLRAYSITLENAFDRHQLSRLLNEFGPAPLGTTGQETALWEAAEGLLLKAHQASLGALMVDDLHFADLSSLQALRWLTACKGLEALCFGFTTRGELASELRTFLDTWLTDPKAPVVVDLTPLGEEDIAQLIDDVSLPERLPPKLAAALHSHAGGIPYFSLQTLIDLWQQEGSPAHFGLSMPASVVPRLRARLQALPSAHTEFLWAAALMGGHFTPERAGAAMGLGKLELNETLLALERGLVFAGPRFRHDLMRECALLDVPPALRPLLHARVAESLSSDPAIAAGQLAYHWEAAERWAPAARSLLAAAAAAIMTGQVLFHQTFLERAANCFQRAAETDAAFDAWCRRADAMILLGGPQGILDELPHLQAIARTDWQRLRVTLLRADALLHMGDKNDEVLRMTDALMRDPAVDIGLRIGALILRTTALAQSGRLGEALTTQELASTLAERHGNRDQILQLTHLQVVVLFHNGKIGQAVEAARRSADLTRASGNLVEAVQVEGNLCTLLTVSGDTREAYALARRVQHQHNTMGSSTNSITRGMNLVALGNSAAWHGYFDEALTALNASVGILGEHSAVPARVVACVSLAYLWLALGDSRKAGDALPLLSDVKAPGMQMRWHWVQARLAAMEGRPAAVTLDRIGAIQAAHPDLPHGQSGWIEWSWQGRAHEVVARLSDLRQEAMQAGMLGFARATMARELDRLVEIGDPQALQSALKITDALGDVDAGSMSFQVYIPQVWLTLAQMWELVGEADRSAQARARGVEWVQIATEHTRLELRANFRRGNPVNRKLLGDEANDRTVPVEGLTGNSLV